MPRNRKKRRAPSKPYYDLKEVKRLVVNKRVRINYNALEGAWYAFSWEESDILDAIVKLRLNHFQKSDPSETKPGIILDFYKAPGLNDENVYTHFYIEKETGILVINSFKGF